MRRNREEKKFTLTFFRVGFYLVYGVQWNQEFISVYSGYWDGIRRKEKNNSAHNVVQLTLKALSERVNYFFSSTPI